MTIEDYAMAVITHADTWMYPLDMKDAVNMVLEFADDVEWSASHADEYKYRGEEITLRLLATEIAEKVLEMWDGEMRERSYDDPELTERQHGPPQGFIPGRIRR